MAWNFNLRKRQPREETRFEKNFREVTEAGIKIRTAYGTITPTEAGRPRVGQRA